MYCIYNKIIIIKGGIKLTLNVTIKVSDMKGVDKMKQEFAPRNIEEALYVESTEKQENSFYDVFPSLDEEEMVRYKIMAGIPLTDQ